MSLAPNPPAAPFPHGRRPGSIRRAGDGANGTGEQGAKTCSIVFQTFHSPSDSPLHAAVVEHPAARCPAFWLARARRPDACGNAPPPLAFARLPRVDKIRA
jgi:hypothetical protein